jgi:20S proteasome subunit alpha 6
VPKAEGDEERDSTEKGESEDGVESKPVPEFATLDTSVKPSSISTPPPSRIRIYFHTPVTADDSHPILHASSFRHDTMPSDSRKGKRKKLEDDDGDLEEGRGRPPPPQMGSTMSDDRSSVAASVAPSIADTAVSEGDWLMAAIVEDEGEQDADADGEDDKDDQLGVSQVMDIHHPGEMSGANGAAKTDINGKSLHHV